MMGRYTYTMQNGKRIGLLRTAHGDVSFPTFMPVTTFGEKYPLDKLIQPYLKRLSQCLMVSHFYAQQMKKRPQMPLFIDSGGFAGLFEGSEFVEHADYASIKTKEEDEINPLDVLEFQEKNADIGATLDAIIPPGLDEKECIRRQRITIKNALYSLKHLKSKDLILYASLQCWDEASARYIAKIYADAGFEGIAIGGMVPRAKDTEYMKTIVHAVRDEAPNCAIHVFGCGNMETIPILIEQGADSFDSSSYVRNAVDRRSSSGRMGVHTGLWEAVFALKNLKNIIFELS